MGLLSSVKNFFTASEQKKAVQRVAAVLNPFDNDKLSFVNPITGSTKEATGVKTIVRTAEVGAVAYGAAVVAPTAVSTVSSGIGKAVANNPIKTTAAAVLIAPGAIKAVASNPDKASAAAFNVAAATNNFTQNVGEFALDPSLEKAKEIVTENPIVAAAAGTALAVAVGGGIAGAVATVTNTMAVKENTKQMQSGNPSLPGTPTPPAALGGLAPVSAVSDKPADVLAATPATANTPDKIVKPRAAGKRRTKRKVNKCHHPRELHGRFNFRLS